MSNTSDQYKEVYNKIAWANAKQIKPNEVTEEDIILHETFKLGKLYNSHDTIKKYF